MATISSFEDLLERSAEPERKFERVAVTGLGIVSPLGNSVEENWKNLIAGKSGIGKLTRFNPNDYGADKDFSCVAGELKGFDLKNWGVDFKIVKRMDLVSQYLVAAAIEAARHSGIDAFIRENPYRVGVIAGSGFGGAETWEEQYQTLKERGVNKISPFLVPKISANLAPSWVSIILGAKGPNFNINSACASSGHAIAIAFSLIRIGAADIIITGGVEASITPLALSGFNRMGAVSKKWNDYPEKASRPFDKNRDGFVIAEGAGVIVLESFRHATRRQAPNILAELAGIGMTADAFHITDPSVEGPKEAMRLALEDAGLKTSSIDYINAHGTSTIVGDVNETNAIKELFKGFTQGVCVSSTKSMTGHMIGAAGGAEAIFTIIAIKDGAVPPTINLENPDPECDLDYVPNKARRILVRAALSNSFGFGGTNVSLAFKRA